MKSVVKKLPLPIFPTELPILQPGSLHLYFFNLDSTLPAPISAVVLSADELARAARFKYDLHRQRYIHGRQTLRALLGACLNLPPAQLTFQYAPAGKPSLAVAGLPSHTLDFNLAHSNARALLAIARSSAPDPASPISISPPSPTPASASAIPSTPLHLGADIEEIHDIEDMRLVAEHSFAEDEFRRWDQIPATDPDRIPAFYRIWTRKEAYLKATGEGIAHRLKQFTVAFEKNAAPKILTGADTHWTLLDTSPNPATAAAIATNHPPTELTIFTIENSPL